MPPAMRGIIRDGIRRTFTTLRVYEEDNRRESDLIIEWRGTRYRISCEQIPPKKEISARHGTL
jgi:hypothetical protein